MKKYKMINLAYPLNATPSYMKEQRKEMELRLLAEVRWYRLERMGNFRRSIDTTNRIVSMSLEWEERYA